MNLKQVQIDTMIDTVRLLFIVLSFILVLSPIGMASGNTMNKYCPVTTTELAEEQFFVDYNGQRIYFCCNKCKKDFLADPEAYLANVSYEDEPSGEHEHTSPAEHDASPEPNSSSSEPAHAEENTHDHAIDHESTSSLVTFLGKFHPMMTHFPIALILTALLFSALGYIRPGSFDMISVYLMYIASLSGIATVSLGLLAGAGASYPTFLADYFTTHRFLGITTGIFTLVTTFFGYRLLRNKQPEILWIYRLLLLLTAILVGVTGHYGATLVFGPDYFNI